MRKFMQTLARRDKQLGKVTEHATEIFSTTFCRYEVELAKLTLGAIRAFLAGMPPGAQMDQVSDPGALRRMLVDYMPAFFRIRGLSQRIATSHGLWALVALSTS